MYGVDVYACDSGAAVSAEAEVRVRGQRSEIPEFCVHGGIWEETRRECVIARMCGYSVKTERENMKSKEKTQKKERNRTCVLRVKRRVRATCAGVAKRQRAAMLRTTGKRGEKGFA